MVAGFLENDCMEPTAGSRDNIGTISARRAWIPLKEGKTKLMMHEIAVAMGLGLLDLGCPKLTMGRITAFGLGKRAASVREQVPLELWVPA